MKTLKTILDIAYLCFFLSLYLPLPSLCVFVIVVIIIIL